MENPAPIRVRFFRGKPLPPNTYYVGRPSVFGNPLRVGRHAKTRAEAVAMYRDYISKMPELIKYAKEQLRGKNLACWCPLDDMCHADVLLEIANK